MASNIHTSCVLTCFSNHHNDNGNDDEDEDDMPY